ncbi:MAG: LacI family DNA-binding transcriptional regulator [Bacillota bacterium]|nr:LacI family DNA-binding transcriptional regulator [Bacillota bacterium]
MKITIKDVAKLAGVSPSTVSRVISDSSRISDETKRNVRSVMEELGYYPNAIARSLVSKSTNTIGIVMPQSAERSLLNPFFPVVLSGISAAAHEKDYCIVLSTGNTEKEQMESIKEIVTSGRVDGVIIMYSSMDNVILESMKKFKMPVIIIGKPLQTDGILYVDNDNVAAAYEVTKELIDRGHKDIALVSGHFGYVVSLDRLDGYRAALVDNNIGINRKLIIECEFNKEDGYRGMKEMLDKGVRPTAVVVTDDIMALGVMEAIKEQGMRIPEEIEIISFNNIPFADLCNPGLTSVDVNAYTLGYEASKLIIEKIKSEDDKGRVIVPTRIFYRGTTR